MSILILNRYLKMKEAILRQSKFDEYKMNKICIFCNKNKSMITLKQ